MYKKQLTVVLVLLLACVLCFGACTVKGNEQDGNKDGIISSVTNPTQLSGSVESVLAGSSAHTNSGSFLKPTDYVWVIVKTEGETAAESYLESSNGYGSLSEYIASAEGQAHIAVLTETQNAVKALLDKQSLVAEYDYSYTTVNNGFAAYVQYGDIDVIEGFPYVEEVIISELYNAPSATVSSSVYTSYDATTGMITNESGYNGEGMTIGVIDSGFDYTHRAFQKAPETPWFSAEDIERVIPYLTASTIKSFTINNVYRSAKVPYTFDYADKDTDTNTPSGSDSGYHGTHVAGIVAGDDDTITGSASQAQILAFKVFGNYSTGAYMQDIMAALNDAALIGVDAVNLSLGTACGFAKEVESSRLFINDTYETLRQLGIGVIAAAGNEGETYYIMKDGAISIENPEYSAVGSPASYYASLAIASAYSIKYDHFEANGQNIILWNAAYADGTKVDFAKSFLNGAASVNAEIVLVGGFGEASDYEGIDVTGKIALIQRGSLSFTDKARNAAANGAVGAIIYNNVEQHINAQIEDDVKIPVATIDMASGAYLIEMLSEGNNEITFIENSEYFPMEDYSSWGPISDLTLNPDITAPGGDIYSAIPTSMYSQVGSYYGYLSGTSMASPNLAGAYLNIKQYIKENYLGLTEIEMRTLIYQLMMSTAKVMYDANGDLVSPRKQGAGMINIDSAISSKAYLTVTGIDKTKLSLGDDKERDGIYTLRFNLVNRSEEALSYELDVLTITEALDETKEHITLSSYELNKNYKVTVTNGTYENGIVTVEANSKAKITVVITLTEDSIEYLNIFPNGTYVEGFVVFNAEAEEEADLSIPYLAFYGDWTEANAFDNCIYDSYGDYYIYGNGGIYTLDSYQWDYDNEEAFYMMHMLGAYDLFVTPDGFETPATTADRISLSLTEGAYTQLYTVETVLLRDAYRLSYTIRDKVTGVEYWIGQSFNEHKTYSNGVYGFVTAYEFNLDMRDFTFSNNQQLEVLIRAELPYEGCNDVQEQIVPIFIDNEAPVLNEATIRRENGRVYVDLDIYDNHYLNRLCFSTLDNGGQVTTGYGYAIPVANWQKGTDNKLTYDITDYIEWLINGELVISLYDNAENGSNFYVGNVNGEASENQTVNGASQSVVNGSESSFVVGSENADYVVNNTTTSADFAASDEMTTTMVGTNAVTTVGEHKYTVNGYTLVGYDGPGGYLVIPEELGIRYISRSAFERNDTITGVEIPEGVTQLLICAFFDCYNIEKIVLPSTLTHIGNSVFYDNVKLTSLNLEDTKVYSYGAAAFGNVGLKEIIFPEVGRAVDLGMWMIQHCINLERLVFNCDIKTTNSSIEYCPNLKEVIFNGDVQSFTGFTLFGSPNLTNLEFNGYVGSIGSKNRLWDASFGMLGIKELHFKGDVGSIYSTSFSNCPDLEKVVFYGSVDYISGSSFVKSNIKSFTIAEGNDNLVMDNATGIMYNADYTTMFVPNDWDYNGVLELPETLEVVPDGAFGQAHEYLVYVGLSVGWDYEGGGGYIKRAGYGFNLVSDTKNIKGVIFPEYVEEIGMLTFYNCTNLETVSLGENITNIGQYAFANCYNIKQLENLDYVESIGYYTFSNCYNLQEFIFSENMTSVNDYAFINCYNLTRVEAPGLCDYLGISAFENCYSLSELTVSEDLEEIYYHAFRNCKSLKEFIAPGVYWLGAEAFKNCESLVRVELSEDLMEIYDYTFYNCYSLAEINELPNLEYIAKYAFTNTSSLTDFYFSDCIYSIGKMAFAYSGLTSLVFDFDIAFPADAFYGLMNLETIEFTNDTSYYTVEDEILYSLDMTELLIFPAMKDASEYVLPETVDTIAAYAFYCNETLTSINLENVSYVGKAAFEFSGLKEVNIHDDMFIDIYAFSNLNLDKLTISENASKFDYIYVFYATDVNEFELAEGNVVAKMSGDYLTNANGTIIFRYFGEEENLVIPEGVVAIGELAFDGCESLVSVKFPTTLKVIGHCAFDNCVNLETLIFTSEEAPALYGLETYFNFGYAFGEENNMKIYTPDTDSYKTYLWRNFFSEHYVENNGSYVDVNGETVENNASEAQNSGFLATVFASENIGMLAMAAGLTSLVAAAVVLVKKFF